ncbi:amidohydrolase [Mesorhizobium sp. M2D.F.Ca.ET.185.01.1.1]|uniref:amidohydrolase family protein n=1 Tax=unclassified Mesorhizobium TaxID=325217 RepID=UPI000FCA0088|nr:MULTISPECIES: amidohydrolase [unclassified Mesorhizobium]TGP82268.1 amidohydrolase [bacterium M00.F.Ca.ET.227.01.1.1]TGP91847.1 amidohydrolase [bacterium M00.F.Ca.ET.221.01.1.1]TGP95366.1 amidohydrolase [bacterium M00.F.Ca.ET.222.01.1.1]TGT71380.1 amidohydrolase [bacterium M00.F.Ca.ET.159.01.1.1]TGT83557.1 amidohydrolase [bacterium M00.F.Ca.ET.157.01.1.1]TGU03638.1 amidohydrolase [bacterium M00.F.Ca.ET.163.01.1.1]TGU38704.1 amidohydrolase [bacterium M00.F.Ca.ET.156.01.1.1]TGU47951.1 amid
MIIDTHLHLIDQGALRYPWLVGVPALNRDFSYEEYAADARRSGIDGVLHMEVDVDSADIAAETAYVKSLAGRAGSLLRGAIASCRPEEAGFEAYLETVKAEPFVKGFRRVLHVIPDDVSEGALFRQNIKRLAGTGLTFDLVVLPHQIPKAIALADLAPDVQFVLDHCGVPDIKAKAEHPWRERMGAIAKRPNVTAKISGVVAYTDPATWTVETLKPYVEHTIRCFGWDRVIWGSDWPVCTLGGGLTTWIAATHALLAGASNSERTRLLSGNARRLWRLD